MMELVVAEHAAVEAARRIAVLLRGAIDARGRATCAVSGGSTAPPMFAVLVGLDVDWRRVDVWQVDERVAPDGHADRNAGQLGELIDAGATVHPMPVTADDLDAAARRYAEHLPTRFDVVHLGLGADGHTASWPPGDDDVADASEPVVVTRDEFNGYRRMTLTPRVVNGAADRVLLTIGPDKRAVVTRWLAGDSSLPVSRVRVDGTVVVVDPAAAPDGRG